MEVLALYPKQLFPADLLRGAFDAASAAVAATGAWGLPQAPQITSSDPDEAWGQFLSAYVQLETLGRAVDPRMLAYAAANGMYGPLNCHTGFFRPKLYTELLASDEGQPSVGSGQQFAGPAASRTPASRLTPKRG